MFIKSRIIKTAVKLLCPALFAILMVGSVCFADEDEDEVLPKKAYSLGMERPKTTPKVIIKEKIVIQCPPGSNWNADIKRCQNEDGEDIAQAPKAKKKQQPKVAEEEGEPVPKPRASATNIPDYNYIYPRTKLRVKVGQCIMTGEAMTCDITYINTAAGNTVVTEDPKTTSIIDNLGNKFLQTSARCSPSSYCRVAYGNAIKITYNFTYLDTRATSITFTSVTHANGETDLIKLENFPITK
ncbi:MAG: hypothetical protein WCI45_01955 [Desulfuromonadales bacterium]